MTTTTDTEAAALAQAAALAEKTITTMTTTTLTDTEAAALAQAGAFTKAVVFDEDALLAQAAFRAVWNNKYLLQLIYAKIRRNNNADEAAEYGNLQAFKYWTLTDCSDKTVSIAAHHGHGDVLQILHNRDLRLKKPFKHIAYHAAKHGHLTVIQFLHNNFYAELKELFPFVICDAAEHGNLEIVKFLRHFSKDQATMDYAAANGHLHIVQYFHETVHVEFPSYVTTNAAANGHLHIVRYFHNIGVTCTTGAMVEAARHGYMDIIQYLHDEVKVRCIEMAVNLAALNGRLEVLKYLHDEVKAHLYIENGNCSFSNAMNWAAEKGHLEAVQYLHDKFKAQCTEQVVNIAAKNGHFEVVEYLLDFVKNRLLCRNLHVVQFKNCKKTSICPTRESTPIVKYAMTYKESSFWVIWRNKRLLQKIYEYNRGRDMIKAAKYGNLQAFRYGNLKAFKYGKSTYCTADAITDAINTARANYKYELEQFLLEYE